MELIWNSGKAFLLFLSFPGYFFVVYRFGKVRKWFVPVVSMSGIGLVLFWGGLLNCLALTADLLLLGGVAGFAVFLVFFIRGEIHLPEGSLCGFCFVLGTMAFALLSLNLKMIHYDNFSHWALIVKYLLSADRFPGADSILIPFRDYPPGSSLFIYYVCRFAGHSQGMMILAQNSLIFACFYAVFGIVKERRRFLLYSFLGMGCAVLSYLNLTIRINNLLVDFLLPLLAMASLAVSWRYREEPERICFLQIILLGYTGIVKSTGIFFAGTAAAYALWILIRTERQNARKICGGKSEENVKLHSRRKLFRDMRCRMRVILWGALMTAGSALPVLAWQHHLNTDLAGFEGKFGQWLTAGAQQAAGDYGAPVGRELYGQVTEAFLKAAFDPSGRALQIIFLSLILAAGAVLYARFRMKKKWRLGWILVSGIAVTVLYYAGMLYLYLFSMPAEEALRLAGFERYACSAAVLFAGSLIMGMTVDLEQSFAVNIDERGAYRAYSSPGAKRRYQWAVLGTVILGINFLYSEFNGLRSIRAGYETSLPGQVERIAGDHWYENGETDTRKYLIVAPDENGQVSSGEVRYVCRYFLWAPDVYVTSSLSTDGMKQTEAEYDRIIVLK
ncbi:MAG TPA: hypothetical protein H9794_02610 [Candidatus Mediterraneibacter merdigallinarum]|nr:hypothetical protein [Candidatus Mediterraneibacter merdigallinarum]